MNQTILSAKQSDLLESLIVKHGQVVSTDQIIREAGRYWDYKQASNLITRLIQNGWLIRIKRGLYAISDFNSRGFLSLSPYAVAHLLEPESYVSFEAALHYHGMFDQLVRKVISVSLKSRKPSMLGAMEYRFVRSKPAHYFGWQALSDGGLTAQIATPEKALIDMVNFHKSHYSIDLLIEKLRENKDALDFSRVTDYLNKFPVTTIKIFGLVFDLIGIDSADLHRLIKPTGTNWMLPGDTKFNAKWRLYYKDDLDRYRAL